MATVRQAISISRVNVPLVDTGWRVGMPHGINQPTLPLRETSVQAVLCRVEKFNPHTPCIRHPRNPELMRRVMFVEVHGLGIFGK